MPGQGDVAAIIDDAHDSAKLTLAAVVYPDDVDDYPIAVVLKNTSGLFIYAHGQNTKNDYSVLVEVAKARLDVAGIGDGEADGFHFRSMQSLGTVCTIVGDAGSSPYSTRPGESLNNTAVAAAVGEIYTSQHDA